MLIKCPECGHQVSDQAKTCPSCGIEIAGKTCRCPDCGEVIFKEQSFCPNCHCSINGASLPEPAQEPLPASQREKPEAKLEKQPAPRRPRKKRVGLMALIMAFVIALIVVFLGIYFMKMQEQQNEQRAFQNAMRSTEPLVLQNFLDMYKEAPIAHRDSIKNYLEALKKVDSDWADALVNNSRQSYERYMKKYPQSTHNVEAKIKIDSIDWMTACKENTTDAFRKYLVEHSDGAYYDEARANYDHLDAQKISPEDRLLVSQLFTAYFSALAQKDITALMETLAPVLTSFLHKQNATKNDVIQYMEKMHEQDILKMEFVLNNDWQIEKRMLSEGLYSLSVKFSAVQRIERSDDTRETSAVYKISAQVSPEGLITEMNMKRSIQ